MKDSYISINEREKRLGINAETGGHQGTDTGTAEVVSEKPHAAVKFGSDKQEGSKDL